MKKIKSASGLVYKWQGEFFFILLLYRNNTNTWHLPKGIVEMGEGLHEAAEREIEEETGFNVQVQKYLGSLKSNWVTLGVSGEELVEKETYYFLAKYQSGFLKPNIEHEECKWFEINDTRELLASHRPYQYFNGKKIYWENEVKIIDLVIDLIKAQPTNAS